VPLERLAALLPIVTAAMCAGVGIATSGWGVRPPPDVKPTALLPERPSVDGQPAPPKTLVKAIHPAKVFSIRLDGGAP
jgi:hypothetical protein